MSIISFNRVSQEAASASLKEKRFSIILDAGHGGEDGGASSGSGVLEKDINLSIALYLKDFAVLSGIDVLMIRETDIDLGNKNLVTVKERKVSDLKNRLNIIQENPDRIFISIHQNYFEQKQYYGAQIFYSPNNALSEELSEYIRASIVRNIQPENTREAKPADKKIYLLSHAESPAVIVECGFLSNDAEAGKLSETQYQKKMAFAIWCGLIEFFNSQDS